MIIDTLLIVLLCGLLLAFLREAFNYRHIFQRKKTSRVRCRNGSKPQKKTKIKVKSKPVSQGGGQAKADLLEDLPSQLQDLIQNTLNSSAGLLSTDGDSYTVTTVTTNGKSHYQFTDSSGKVHGYSSVEDMDPEIQVMFNGSLGNLGSTFGDIKLPGTSADEALSPALGKKAGEKSPVATKRKPPEEPAPAGPKKLNYIPLDPEEFSDDDEGEES